MTGSTALDSSTVESRPSRRAFISLIGGGDLSLPKYETQACTRFPMIRTIDLVGKKLFDGAPVVRYDVGQYRRNKNDLEKSTVVASADG